MGWFDEQLKQRKANDDAVFDDAFVEIAGAVTGSKIKEALSDSQRAKDAIDAILKFYHIKPSEVPDSVKDINGQLEFLLRPHGVMRRTVTLEKGWYRDAIGAMLAVRKSDGSAVALLPTGISGYTYYDSEKGKRVKVGRKTQQLFEDEAIAFYSSFPLRKIGIPDLLRYIVHTLSVSDFVLFGLVTLMVTMIGMISPKLTNLLFSSVLESGNLRALLSMAVFMISVSASSLLIGGVKSLLLSRINTKTELAVQSATMMRVLRISSRITARAICRHVPSRSMRFAVC